MHFNEESNGIVDDLTNGDSENKSAKLPDIKTGVLETIPINNEPVIASSPEQVPNLLVH